ncbi:MAG: tetratricopeptide repeat protein [Planctomycetes bacterium]|nr:tetratricopeptide repeat protein [Planctomycetota bacterium]
MFALSALCLPLLAASLLPAEDAREVPAASAAELGAERCVDCHGAVVERYARSGMARALGPVRAADVAGLGRVSDDEAGLAYRFDATGKRPRLVESWKVGEGEARYTVQLASDLLFRVGAGHQDRSFAALRGRTMRFAPVEVLSAADGAAHAALAPGAMMRSGTRWQVPITVECLACHTGALPPLDYPHHLAPPPAWSPRGIGCDVCHGAAEAHADWREREADGEVLAGDDPLELAAPQSDRARLSLCARCHLQGDARLALENGRRGLSAPGVDHLEEWAVYLPATEDTDVAFVSQVERLARSRCFTASYGARTLTCTTCHDPHGTLRDADERAAARRACLQCHGEAEPFGGACAAPAEERAGRDCVDCHMPATRVFDVHGVEIRDHFVRVAPEVHEPGPLRVKHCRDGLLARFAWPDSPPAAEDLGLELMAALAADQKPRARDLVDVPPGPVSARLATYHHLRGALLEELGRVSEAVDSYERALELDPDAAETRVNLGLLLGAVGRTEEGVAQLDRVLAAHPQAEGALRNRAILRQRLGDEEGFAADLRAAQRIAPRGLLARVLAEYHRRRGEEDEALGWELEARRLEP